MPQLTNTNRKAVQSGRFPWLGLVSPRHIKARTNPTTIPKPLRLTPSDNTLAVTIPNIGQAITGPSDPRWVLAVRTAESIDSGVLAPDKREKLTRVGQMLGLRPFDTSLVIAIVQDQARRGYAPEFCPTAGEPQLRMIPLPQARPNKLQRAFGTAAGVVALIAAEIAAVAWFIA